MTPRRSPRPALPPPRREPFWPLPSPGQRQPFRPSPHRPFQKRPMTTLSPRDTLPDPMTVCIAAISNNHDAIITASDMMLSDDVSSIDNAAFKTRALTNPGAEENWHCMYAGSPDTFDELFWNIRAHLKEHPQDSESDTAMKAAVEKAYSTVTTHRIETGVLSAFGISRDEFFQTGVQRFGESYFKQLAEECRSVKLDTDMLVVGFEVRKFATHNARVPHIFTAQKETGTCASQDQLKFQAIGAGAWAAMGSLFSREFLTERSVNEIVYILCEAKFVSEMARSVGGSTMVEVFYADGSASSLFVDVKKDAIRSAWNRYQNRVTPQEALASIDEQLKRRLRSAPRDTTRP